MDKQNKMHRLLFDAMGMNSNKKIQNWKDIAAAEEELYLLQAKKDPKEYHSVKNKPIFKNYKTLKDFQIDGLNWLIRNWH